jgi:hypothetical protein
MEIKNNKETDWEIVINGMKTIHLIKVLNEEESIDKTMRQILEETFLDLKDYRVLNNGVLMMAAYLQFAYLQETEFNEIEFDKFDFSDFDISFPTTLILNKDIAKKIRNSIAHGRYKFIKNDELYFENYNENDYKITFKATIPIVKFGDFINQFALDVICKN